ncbi:hypothetical protein [Weissella muntiaci]|uniref:hypothetical protein n=1 Tax=Weissella muntiaci TaxID=2508881 RepID=UPI0016523322|nr:hypothetical protein [Weissella muntiaci]
MAKHTFGFYFKRRHDPKWHDDYVIAVCNKIIVSGLIIFVMEIIAGLSISLGLF